MTTVTVTIPGKVMLAGEFAVLRGAPALAIAIDRGMTVTFADDPTVADGCVSVTSSLWPQHRDILFSLRAGHHSLPPDIVDEAQPLLHCLNFARDAFGISRGRLTITSDLDPRFGFGSSSALRLGVLAAIAASRKAEVSPLTIWQYAHALQKTAQPAASGYDSATQILGGVVRFCGAQEFVQRPVLGSFAALNARKDESNHSLSSIRIMVGGGGALTGSIMRPTLAWLEQNSRWSRLLELSPVTSAAFEQLLTADQASCPAALAATIAAVGAERTFWQDAPMFPLSIGATLNTLDGCDSTWTYKTTGAGGEDALLLIGDSAQTQQAIDALSARGWVPLAVSIAQRGLTMSTPVSAASHSPAGSASALTADLQDGAERRRSEVTHAH